MTSRPNHAQRTVSAIFVPGLSLVDLIARLEDADYSIGGFVKCDDSDRHVWVQRYLGVFDRMKRVREDAPALPSDALILISHSIIGEKHVIDPRTGSVSRYREPPEVISADPRAKGSPFDLDPAAAGLRAP